MAKVKNKRENHATKRGTAAAPAQRASRPERTSRPERPSRDYGVGRDYSAGRNSGGQNRRTFEEQAAPYEENPNLLIGRNPIMEALKNDREIDKIMVCATEGSMIKILAMAKEKGIPVMMVEKQALDRMSGGRPHQGAAAHISPYEYAEMEDIFRRAEEKGEDPFIIILDNLEDPHNLGAIMRTAECAGAHGVIIPKRRSCGLTEVVAKASAGAIEYMPCVKVTNIVSAIEELKSKGLWIAACDMGGPEYYKADLKGKLAVVIGSEGNGISKLVKEKCDFIVSMPMVGKISSLNASNAAAVIIYEVRKQRDGN